MKISEYAVKNYQFTLIMFLMAAAVGITTLLTMPRGEDPETESPQLCSQSINHNQQLSCCPTPLYKVEHTTRCSIEQCMGLSTPQLILLLFSFLITAIFFK